jgi:hypothetical protein
MIHPRAMAALHRVALLPKQDRLRRALASGDMKEIYAHGTDLESPEYFTSERTVSGWDGSGAAGATYSGLWPVGRACRALGFFARRGGWVDAHREPEEIEEWLVAAEAVAALIVAREPDEDGDVIYWIPPAPEET